MNAAARHALNAYSTVGTEIGVVSASPHKLILMLYEGALLAIAAARSNMQQNAPSAPDIAAKGEAVSKAIAIIEEGLKLCLDEKAGGEIAQNLKALYEYMAQRLLHANLKNDVVALDEVSRLLRELKEAWETIGGQQAAAGAEAVKPQQHSAALAYGKV